MTWFSAKYLKIPVMWETDQNLMWGTNRTGRAGMWRSYSYVYTLWIVVFKLLSWKLLMTVALQMLKLRLTHRAYLFLDISILKMFPFMKLIHIYFTNQLNCSSNQLNCSYSLPFAQLHNFELHKILHRKTCISKMARDGLMFELNQHERTS